MTANIRNDRGYLAQIHQQKAVGKFGNVNNIKGFSTRLYLGSVSAKLPTKVENSLP